jgi:hypothetical protein
MRWIFSRDVFGDWCWEQLSDTSEVIAESRYSFESRAEAEADAAKHGFDANTPAEHDNNRAKRAGNAT